MVTTEIEYPIIDYEARVSEPPCDLTKYYLKEIETTTINNHYFYGGNDIVKVWEQHLKQINPGIKFYVQSDITDNYVEVDSLFNDMSQLKEHALVLCS